MTHQLIVKSRLYVPKKLMSSKAIESRYNIVIYDERSCVKCDNKVDRPNGMCYDGCPALIADYKLWKDESDKYYSVPQGDLLGLTRVLDRKGKDYEIVDKRKSIPFSMPIKWTGSLYGEGYVDDDGNPRADQKKVVKAWWKYKAGILRAPPRSGKTPMAVYLACKLGQKTIIFAHQYEFLKQFLKTIYEHTNIKEMERQARRPLVTIVNSVAQLKKAKDYEIGRAHV